MKESASIGDWEALMNVIIQNSLILIISVFILCFEDPCGIITNQHTRNITISISNTSYLKLKLIEPFNINQLKNAGLLINQIVDFDESFKEKRVCVKANYDKDLDEYVHVYAGLDDLLV